MSQISASCQGIVNRAMLLSDSVNMAAVSYDDIQNSLNEGMKDLYNLLTDANDDYFMVLTTLSLANSITSPALNTNEWLLQLPDDFYKLRFIDYNYSGTWQRMKRFSLDQRNDYNGVLQYRFQGQNLWLVGSMSSGAAVSVRIGYYPAIDPIYSPGPSVLYDTGLSDAVMAGANYPFYVYGGRSQPLPESTTSAQPNYDGLLFSTSTGYLYYSSQKTGLTTALNSIPGSYKYPIYLNGFLYYSEIGTIYAQPLNPEVPVEGSRGTVYTGTSIDQMFIVGRDLYFIDNGACKVGTPVGISAMTASAFGGVLESSGVTSFHPNVGGYVHLIKGGAFLYINGVEITTTNPSVLVSDGEHSFVTNYTNNKPNKLHRLTVDMTVTTAPTILRAEIVCDNVKYNSIHQPRNGNIGICEYDGSGLYTASTTPDFIITYPNNLVPEILAYQLAVDIKRKMGADIADLTTRKQELYLRFMNVIRRDENTPERIRNSTRASINAGQYGGY